MVNVYRFTFVPIRPHCDHNDINTQSSVAYSQEYCMGGAKYTNTIPMSFIYTFYFFIYLDKILR